MVSASFGVSFTFGFCSGMILKPTIKSRTCLSQEYKNVTLDSSYQNHNRLTFNVSVSKGNSIIELERYQDETIINENNPSIKSLNKKSHDDLTPLVSALKASAMQNAASFHFPGHNRGHAAPSSLTKLIGLNPFIHDLPELPETMDATLIAQKKAAKLFGASETWFLVGGTTCGIQTAIMSVCSPGDSLILPRNSHLSAFSAMVLSGVIPKYVIPEYNSDWDIAGGVTPSQIEKAINELWIKGRRTGAVLVTSPTYHGICSNLVEISHVCHSHSIPLIVDEAHGAHLGFHPKLPPSALSQGADISVQSTHKVLCSLTQASMLHINGNIVDKERISRSLQTLQTTSPSFLLLASLDATRAQLSKNPEKLFGKALDLVFKAKKMLEKIPGISVLNVSSFSSRFIYVDPLRINIGVSNLGLSGFEADDFLFSEYGVVSELVGTRAITLAFNLGTCQEHVHRLVSGLRDLSSKYVLNQDKRYEKVLLLAPFSDVRISISPREAFFARKRKVNLDDSFGKVCGELICPYPPGIPLLYPGEIITKEALDYLILIKGNGAAITGASDVLLNTILICA